MRRTYRSKKDTGGALDHRDVLLNIDEKSSAFDAFYIQNIKQTKRELSCVGQSNAYGVASKKIQKRKYVKRIVKEIENVQKESMSTSTYLTPDKSIRVNKVLDPFDELLNSSTNGQVINTASNNCVFDTLLPKKQGKTYTRKNMTKAKKNLCEYSSDSDKENTSDLQSNMTDIRTHELLVERELSKCPKYFDESINKIVNNLSLINNYKNKTNTSFNTSYKLHRNRITKNSQSPILQKSPLCSTPFKDKYRGKSIYNFSPITIKERESTNNVTMAEENNECNNSIVFLCKEKVPKLSKEHTQPHISVKSIEEKSNNQSLLYKDQIDPLTRSDVCETKKVQENESELKINSELGSSDQSLFQITEAEPFHGFSDPKITESITDNKIDLLKNMLEDNSHKEKLEPNESIMLSSENLSDENIVEAVVENYKTQRSLENISIDMNLNENRSYKRSLENPSEQDLDVNENDKSNIDTSLKDVDLYVNYSRNGSSYEENYIDKVSFNSKEASLSNLIDISHVSDKESMYDTCESDQSFSEEENNGIKVPKVAIERLSESIFMKYYEKMLVDKTQNTSSCDSIVLIGSQSEGDVTISDVNESQSEVEENYIEIDEENIITDNNVSASFYNCSKNSISSTSKNTEYDSETQANEIIVTDSSTTEDIEYSDEVRNHEDERHVSFVTIRRRNEITNDSMFIFDNSYGSSSTDCDKTVVSNKARLSSFEKSNIELNLSVNTAKSDENGTEPTASKLIQGEDSINVIYRNIRKSSKHNKQSEDTSMDSSINEVTIVGTGQIDDDSIKLNDESFMQSDKTPEHTRSSVTIRKSSRLFRDSNTFDRSSTMDAEVKPNIVLQPGKKWERSLSIYRRMTTMADHLDQTLLDETQKKGRKYRQSVISTMQMQDSLHNESINSRRSTFISKPSRSTIRFVKDSNSSRISLNTTEVFDDLKGFLNEECDDTVIELSKLSLADSEFEVTVLGNLDETSGRVTTARDYVLRRCNQTDPILFDECYPETVLKNCHKIGEGVYGEVFLWRGRDGRARVMKIVPIAGACKVNGEQQKDFHEVISEIVIAMELSALRAPIADIDRYFDEGKDVEALDLHAVENATDVFNEVLAVRCVQGPYPSRLLDLWELYDECKGSENDNPAALPSDQQYMVLELANAGQDLESYQFTGAQQAYALFQQIAFGLAVGEESFQFEHRDLHWGNVLIAPTEQKFATFVLRGRTYRVARGGVAATIIDYSLSRISLPLPLAGEHAALYNDLAPDEQLFDAVGDYQFQVYRLMRDKLGNDWKNFEPYTNILWLHYTVDKMITALRYKRTNTKIHKHYIEKLKGIKERILEYKSATEYVLTDIEI